MTELGPSARALIAATRHGDDPSADDRERVRRKLAAQLPALAAASVSSAAAQSAAQTGHGTTGALGASALTGSALLKSALVAGVALVAFAAAGVIDRGGESAPRGTHPQQAAPVAVVHRSAAPAVPIAIAVPAAMPARALPRAQDAQPTREPAPTPARAALVLPRARLARSVVNAPQPARHVVNEQPARARTVRTAPSSARTPIADARAELGDSLEPIAPSSPDGREPIARNVPPPALVISAPKASAANAAPPAQAPQPALPSLSPELALLASARDALQRGQPARALALTERHAYRFPRGALEDERHALSALALCALGRFEDGRRALRALEASATGTPLLAGGRRACAGGAKPP